MNQPEPATVHSSARSRKRWPLVRAVALLLLITAIVLCVILLPKGFVRDLLKWVQQTGPWGPVVLGLLYIPAAVFMVPGTLLTLFAGFAFDFLPAIIAVSLGSTAGAAAAFLVGRKLVRGFVEQRMARFPRFAAIDRAVATQGFKIVLLMRLSPFLPFNLSNYALGLTKISLGSYVLASWIGMFPATVMYVYLGKTAHNLAELSRSGRDSGFERIMFFAGLVATIAVTFVITRVARRALKQAVSAADREDSVPPA